MIGDLSQRQLAIGGAVLAGALYLRRRGDGGDRNAAEETPELSQRRQRALAQLRQRQSQDRVDPDTGKLTRAEAMDIIEQRTESIEEQSEPDNASRSDRRSPAQVIREYRDELPDDVEWENKVEYDPVTGEPYNPVQLAWLATNVLPDQEGFGQVPDDSESDSGDSGSNGDSS